MTCQRPSSSRTRSSPSAIAAKGEWPFSLELSSVRPTVAVIATSPATPQSRTAMPTRSTGPTPGASSNGGTIQARTEGSATSRSRWPRAERRPRGSAQRADLRRREPGVERQRGELLESKRGADRRRRRTHGLDDSRLGATLERVGQALRHQSRVRSLSPLLRQCRRTAEKDDRRVRQVDQIGGGNGLAVEVHEVYAPLEGKLREERRVEQTHHVEGHAVAGDHDPLQGGGIACEGP